MVKYDIELYENDGNWQAVIADLLVVGKADDPGSAVREVIRRAEENGANLAITGHAVRDTNGAYRAACRTGRKVRDLLVEYGIRTGFLLVLIAAVFLLVRGDVNTQIRQLRLGVISEMELVRQTVDGSAFEEKGRIERLRARAKAINDRLLPVAEELRPLFRTLIADEPTRADAQKK